MDVVDNVERHRYELQIDGATAFLQYQRRAGVVTLIHTEVPPALRGGGVAGQLARFALETARAAGERVVPMCPYVQAYLQKHPEYADLVEH